MTRHRLFRTIWRVNGVLILLTFVLVAVSTVVAAVSALSSLVGRHATRETGAATTSSGERLSYGAVESLEGTPFVIVPLVGEEGGFSSSDSEIRNLLFYEAGSGQARWLRPDNKATVIAHEPLREGPVPRGDEGDDPRPVRWIRYEISSPDGDGRKLSIAVSGPGGADLSVVLPEVDEVLGYSPPRGGVLVVFYRLGDRHLAAEIDLAGRKLRRTAPLPKT